MNWKAWIQSRTLWINTIMAILAIIQVLQGEPWFPVEYQVLIAAILNILLRFLTNQPISITNPTGKPKE